MPIDLICLDADDTLWHNMRHFEAAEAANHAVLASFAEAGVFRDVLNRVEMRNLTLYGYGAKGFTLSTIEAALELIDGNVPRPCLEAILDACKSLLTHPIELLPGVRECLERLATMGRLVLVTKGDLLHQETKLAASGLGGLFSAIEIVSDKTATTYRQVAAKLGSSPDRLIMAGDSLRSDIRPALEAGAYAAYVPPETFWSHEASEKPQDARFFELMSLLDLPDLVKRLDVLPHGEAP